MICVDVDFPPDLIEIQRQYAAVDARVQELRAQEPSGPAIARGHADIPESLRAAVDAARAERLQLVEALVEHSFWSEVQKDKRIEAKQELRKVAASA